MISKLSLSVLQKPIGSGLCCFAGCFNKTLILIGVFVLTGLSSQGNLTDLEEYLEKADHFSQVAWENQKVLELLKEAREHYPENTEILWRISRAYNDIGEYAQRAEGAAAETVEEYFVTARNYADRAIEVDPENSMARTQRAIATGQIALHRGIREAISLTEETREAARKGVELDSFNSVAHYVYARTHAELTQRSRWLLVPLGLGWADLDTALEHFERAIEINPHFIRYRTDAASAFILAGKKNRARQLLEPISELDNQTPFDDDFRVEAREMLDDIH